MKGKMQVSNLLKKDKGFTLIEIVLVLAIAGLIMVIVFLAVAGAQRSRRDTQRKSDIGRVAAALESYASNHAGVYPTPVLFGAPAATANSFAPYATGIGPDPDGTNYAYMTTSTTTPLIHQISETVTGRTYNVCIGLEAGFSCRSNN